jgi:hypothetical protein
VTSDLYGKLTTPARPLASVPGAVCAGSPFTTAAAANGTHSRFAMTGINANVWPLSPQDWSTG